MYHTTLNRIAFLEVKRYLGNMGNHPSQIGAALRRCNRPMFAEPTGNLAEQKDTLFDLLTMEAGPTRRERFFVADLTLSYAHKLLRKHRGSVLEISTFLGPTVVKIAKMYLTVPVYQPSAARCKVERYLLDRIHGYAAEIVDLHSSLTNNEYVKTQTKNKLDLFREDLMRTVWNPSRPFVKWALFDEFNGETCFA